MRRVAWRLSGRVSLFFFEEVGSRAGEVEVGNTIRGLGGGDILIGRGVLIYPDMVNWEIVGLDGW
jgi:hypothetical protein